MATAVTLKSSPSRTETEMLADRDPNLHQHVPDDHLDRRGDQDDDYKLLARTI